MYLYMICEIEDDWRIFGRLLRCHLGGKLKLWDSVTFDEDEKHRYNVRTIK